MPDIKEDIQKALFEEASQLTGGRFVDQSYKNIVAEVISTAKATKEGSYIKITKKIISDIDLQKKAKEFEESKTREQQDEFLQEIIQPQLNPKQHTSDEDLVLIKRNLHDFFSQAVYIISDKENLDKINTKTKEEEGKTDGFTFSPKLRGQENASNKQQQLKGLKSEFNEHLGKTQQASKNFLEELETLKTPSDLHFDPISPLLEKDKVKDAILGLSGKKLTESEISKSIRSKDLKITGEEANNIRNFLQSPAIQKKIRDGDLKFSEKDIKNLLDENDLISKISGEKYQLEFSKNNFTNFLNEKIISSSISFKHNQDKIKTTTETADINNKKLEKLIENPDDLTNLRRFIQTHAKDNKNEQVLTFLNAQNPLVQEAKAAVEQVIEDWGITYKDRLLTTAQSADLNPKKEDNKEIAPLKPPRSTKNRFVKKLLPAGIIASQFPTAFAGNLRGVDEDPTEELHRRAQDNSYSHEYAMNDGNILFLVSGENNLLYRGESAPEQVATLDNAIRTVISFNSNSNTLFYNDYSGQFRSISIGGLTFVDIDTGQTTVVATSTTPEKSTTTKTSITPTSTTSTSTTLTSITTTSTTPTTTGTDTSTTPTTTGTGTTTTPTTTGTGTTTTSTTTITTTPESEYNLVDGIPTLTCRDGSSQDICRLEFSDGGWKVYAKNNVNGIAIPADSNVEFNGERLTIKCPGEQQPYQLSLNNGDITQISCGENKINVNPDDDVQFVNQNGVTVAQVTTPTTTTQSSSTSSTTQSSSTSSTTTTTFSSSFTSVNASTINKNGNNFTFTATTTQDGTTFSAATTTQNGTKVEEVKASGFTPISPNVAASLLYLNRMYDKNHNEGEERKLSEDQSGDNNEGTDNALAFVTAANIILTMLSVFHTYATQVDPQDSAVTQNNKYLEKICEEIPQVIVGTIVGYSLLSAINNDLNNTQKIALTLSSSVMQCVNAIDDVYKIYKDPGKKTDLDSMRNFINSCKSKSMAGLNTEDAANFYKMFTKVFGVRSFSTPVEHGLELFHKVMCGKGTPTMVDDLDLMSESSDRVIPEVIGIPTIGLIPAAPSDRVLPEVIGKKTPPEQPSIEGISEHKTTQNSKKNVLPGNISREGSDESSSSVSATNSNGSPPSVPTTKSIAPGLLVNNPPALTGNPSTSQDSIIDLEKIIFEDDELEKHSVYTINGSEQSINPIDVGKIIHKTAKDYAEKSDDSSSRSSGLSREDKPPSGSAKDPSTPDKSNIKKL